MLFFGKIRKVLLFDSAAAKYLLYAAGEILLVVVGILIALQVNNWNERRQLVELEKGYYQSMKKQLLADRNKLQGDIQYNTMQLENFRTAYEIIVSGDRSRSELLGKLSLGFKDYSDFRQQSNIYETLTSSGDIRLINNKEIVGALQYLESQYVLVERLEDVHRDVVVSHIVPVLVPIVQFDPLEIKKPDSLYDYQILNTLYLVIGLMVEKDHEYQNAIQGMDNTIGLIETELLATN